MVRGEPSERDPGEDGPAPYSPRIMDVIAHIEANYSAPIRLEELAAIAKIDVGRLVRTFTREVGTPPHRYQCDVRVREAQAMLRRGMPPALAALEAGFFDQSHLTRHFKRVCGVTPGRYRGANQAGRIPPSDAGRDALAPSAGRESA